MSLCAIFHSTDSCCIPSPLMNRYDGPQPPEGQNHLYVFTLYALDEMLFLPSLSPTKEDLLQAMSGQILDQAKWTGRFAN
jgi:phosphatidylethanolamine-binding protein (PEBP) family uncharacterized protein